MSKSEINTYSIGMEELAMAFNLINRADLARELLSSIYDNLTEAAVDARLTTASHSLLARGLTGITAQGTPSLDPDFEQALFPLAQFDYTLFLSVVRVDRPLSSTIHVRKGKNFTSHTVQLGVIHLLEHGKSAGLPDFLADVFEDFGSAKEVADKLACKVTWKTLAQAQQPDVKVDRIVELLTTAGIAPATAKILAEDLKKQEYRVILLRSMINSEMPLEEMKKAEKRSMMLLKKEDHAWLFEFDSAEDDAAGSARLVSRDDFKKSINGFII